MIEILKFGRSSLARLFPLLALALVVLVSPGAFPDRPASVVLITIDALRPDRLACYGHPTNKTPQLDRIAREGELFENAYCDVPWTTGSMSSVMTGEYSPRHGVQLPTTRLAPGAATMAERLHSHGFQTGAIIASFPLDAVYGLDQGFEVYDDEFTMPMIEVRGQPVRHVDSRLPAPDDEHDVVIEKFKNDAYRSDEEVTDAAIRWVDNIRDHRPFLLWIHYFGPHEKLLGDVSFTSQEPDIIARYDPDVESADRAVGRFITHLRERELLDETLLIIHADHGQNLGEHDYVGHGMRLADESLRIPLIIRYPRRIPAGLRRQEIVRNVDILPTVIDATGVRSRHPLSGRSLLPREGAFASLRERDQTAYFETQLPTIIYRPLEVPALGTVLGPTRRRGVRTPSWKYIRRDVIGPCERGEPVRDPFGAWSIPKPIPMNVEECKTIRTVALYRESDPAQRNRNVAAEYPAVVSQLDAIVESESGGGSSGAGSFTLSSEMERKLKSLGYLR